MSTISDTIRCSRKVIENFRSSGDFDYYMRERDQRIASLIATKANREAMR